ncbi:hypothetical protein, partial [Escherichia coli]|uniref:hypothetical protein n=1 Tax=Escherichia coli TaxID=562 RepID=UPI001BAF27CE
IFSGVVCPLPLKFRVPYLAPYSPPTLSPLSFPSFLPSIPFSSSYNFYSPPILSTSQFSSSVLSALSTM